MAEFVVLLWLSACAEQAVEQPASRLGEFLHLEDPPTVSLEAIADVAALVEGPPRDTPKAAELDDDQVGPGEPDFPYACERFEVRLREDGRAWHRRLRRRWTEADRKRFRELVELVAEEMGADPRLLTLWALRESTYNPYAIHVLNPDLEASAASWRRHRWDPERAAELEARMDELGAQDPGYWTAKAELARISRFRDNRWYEARAEVEVVLPDGERRTQTTSYWGYGYGPFGFNPTHFLPTWEAADPPWVFCNHDGIAAIVTAVWAARSHQRECESLGFGGSYEVVNRRFSSGHCQPRPSRAAGFRKRARRRGLDVRARAKLGGRWPAETSDRRQILEHMRIKAEAAGLLSNYAGR